MMICRCQNIRAGASIADTIATETAIVITTTATIITQMTIRTIVGCERAKIIGIMPAFSVALDSRESIGTETASWRSGKETNSGA